MLNDSKWVKEPSEKKIRTNDGSMKVSNQKKKKIKKHKQY